MPEEAVLTPSPYTLEALLAWRTARHAWWTLDIPKGLQSVRDRGFLDPRGPGEEPPPAPPGPPHLGVPECPGPGLHPPAGAPGGQVGGGEDRNFRPGQRVDQAWPWLQSDGVPDRIPGGVAGSAYASTSRDVDFGVPVPPTHPTLGLDPPAAAHAEAEAPVSQTWPAPEAEESAPDRVLRHWVPGGRKAKALATARPSERPGLYRAYASTHCPSPAFFTDCARSLAAAGHRDLALGVATALAEVEGAETAHLLRLQDLLEELGAPGLSFQVGSQLMKDHPQDLAHPFRLARLAERQGHPDEAARLLEVVMAGSKNRKTFEALQGLALEERLDLQLRHPRLPRPGIPMGVWGLRVEVSRPDGELPAGLVSLVDPRGERVWENLPLGTRGLGFDGSCPLGPVLFLARRPTPGTYRVELRPDQRVLDEHLPLELRVRVTLGFGAPKAVVREYRVRLAPGPGVLRATTFRVPRGP